MLENCCYHNFEMLTLNMARKGFFGEIVHGEGAYNSSKMRNNFSQKHIFMEFMEPKEQH